MFDLKWIRDQPDTFDRGLGRRGPPAQSPEILRLDKAWREAQTEAERLQAERDTLAEEYAVLSKEYERMYASFMR